MDSNSFFAHLLMSQNPAIPLLCPCLNLHLRPPTTPVLQLDPQRYKQLKADGQFLHSIRSSAYPVDLSTHVAAQNGIGWKRDGNMFKPIGSSHAACVLKYSSFSIDESDFTPVAAPALAPGPSPMTPPQQP